MAALAGMAVYVYRNFDKALNSKDFKLLGPPVIGLAAVGVVLFALRLFACAVVICVILEQARYGLFRVQEAEGGGRLWRRCS